MASSYEVTEYGTLARFVAMTASRDQKILFIFGRAGIGKTTLVEKLIPRGSDNVLWITGHETQADFYCKLYDNPRALIVIDDVDKTKHLTSLLKMAANGEDNDVQFNTTSHVLGEREQRFVGNHAFILIGNTEEKLNDDLKAVRDRGVAVRFNPHLQTVVAKMKEFCEDSEIYDFLSQSSANIDFSLRIYRTCEGMKEHGIDWKDYVRKVYGVKEDEKALLEELSLMSDVTERNKVWINRTGKTPRRLQQLLKDFKRTKYETK